MRRPTPLPEAADLIIKGICQAIANKAGVYDVERLMEGATLRKCSEFGDDIIAAMGSRRLFWSIGSAKR